MFKNRSEKGEFLRQKRIRFHFRGGVRDCSFKAQAKMIIYWDIADKFMNENGSLNRKYQKALLQYRLKNITKKS